jgi:hypothetical protein
MMASQALSATLATVQMTTKNIQITRARLWTGYILSGLTAAFLVMDAIMKLLKPAFVVQATTQLGYPESTIVGIGSVLLTATLLYAIPRTAVLGAVLLTAYMGGAVATNVRAGMPLFNILFPVVFALLFWGGLWLRDKRLQRLLPLIAERSAREEK